jgi:hypothetical protein
VASLLVQFIGAVEDLRRHVGPLLSHGARNAPFDHRDFHGVVQNQAQMTRQCREAFTSLILLRIRY